MPSRHTFPIASVIVILVAGMGVYSNSLHGPFIFDDLQSIVKNPHLRTVWPLTQSMTAPPTSSVAGRPLVCLTLALNYAVGELDVRGYHVVNVAIHLLCALTLFGLARRTLQSPRLKGRFENSAVSLATAVALLWVVHPLTTDAITYVFNRTESMAVLFILLTLYCLNRGGADDDEITSPSRRRKWLVGAIVSAFAAVACKEIAVGLPLLAILYDRAFLAGSFATAMRRRWWMYLGLAASWVLMIALLFQVDVSSHTGAGHQSITPWQYLLTQNGVIVYYLRLCVWPYPLSIDYDGWPIASSLSQVWPYAFIVVALLAATVWALVRRPGLGFLGAMFFLILGPTSSILPIPSEIVGERRMYLPLAAVLMLFVLAVDAAFTRFRKLRPSITPQTWQRLRGGLVIIVATVLGTMTLMRNATFADARAIWEDALAHNPNNVRAHSNLSAVLIQQGESDLVIEHELFALSIKPNYIDAHINLGIAFAMQGRHEQAINEFRWVIDHRPDADAYGNLAALLGESGHYEESIENFHKALKLNPEQAITRQFLPMVLKAKSERDAKAKATTVPASQPAEHK